MTRRLSGSLMVSILTVLVACPALHAQVIGANRERQTDPREQQQDVLHEMASLLEAGGWSISRCGGAYISDMGVPENSFCFQASSFTRHLRENPVALYQLPGQDGWVVAKGTPQRIEAEWGRPEFLRVLRDVVTWANAEGVIIQTDDDSITPMDVVEVDNRAAPLQFARVGRWADNLAGIVQGDDGVLSDDRQDDSRLIQEAVVRVYDGQVLKGSGFFVNDRLLVTNQHVIGGSTEIAIALAGSSDKFPVAKVWSNADLDLALLDDQGVEGHGYLRIAEHPDMASVRTTVWSVGYPGLAERASVGPSDPTERRGTLSRDAFPGWWGADQTSQAMQLQHSAFINGGNSGGPLVNECDQVIGINTFAWATSLRDRTGSEIGRADIPGIYRALHVSELTTRLRRLSQLRPDEDHDWSYDGAAQRCDSSGLR